MRYLSLFSGIEAASVAWIPLGWECVGVAEIEPFPCKVLAHHYPGVPNLGSVTEITEEQINALGRIDLVVGGFPCQDLSIAGKRKGLRNDDGSATRSGLFFTAMRIVEWANPRWVLVENVPGLFSSRNGADFASVVGEMAGCEFSVPRDGWRNAGVAVGKLGLVEWITLDAQYCRTSQHPRAVPQRRRRVFVVRDSGDWQRREPLFLDSESLRGNPPPRREAGKTVAGTIGSRTTGGGGLGTDFDLAGGLQVAPRLTSARMQRIGDPTGQDCVVAFDTTQITSKANFSNPQPGDPCHPLARGAHAPAICMSTGQAGAEIGIGIGTTLNCNHEAPIAFTARDYGNDATASGATPTMRSLCCGADGHQSGAAGLAVCLPINTQISMRHEALGEGTGMGIGDVNDPCFTLQAAHSHAVAYRTNAAGQVNHQDGISAALNTQTDPCAQFIQSSMQVRRLMPIECERLQGFPEVRKSVIVRVINSGGAECSDHQKNCACAAMQNRRLQNVAGSVGKSESQKSVSCAAMSFHANSRSPTSQHAGVNALLNLEALTLEIRSQGKLFSCVSLAEKKNSFPQLTPVESIARPLAQLLSELDRKVQLGEAASQAIINRFSHQENGSPLVNLCGREIEELANDAEKFTTELNECTKSITSEVGQNSQNSEQRLKTLCCFAMSAISTFIPEQIKNVSSYEINLEVSHGYTNIPGASDTTRYKALGNSFAVNAMQLLGQRIQMVSEIPLSVERAE